MKYNPEKHHRRIRLKGYDYSKPGAYFVTIIAQDRKCLFGDVVNGEMDLNKYGNIVEHTWYDLPNHYGNAELDEFIVMPNHVHAIIVLTNAVGAGFKPTMRKPLFEIVRAFKTFSARRFNELRNLRGVPVWQRNYYEHIIRNEQSLNRIREYIINNPRKWDSDNENPKNI